MTINKQALNYFNVTEDEFVDWCKRNNKSFFKTETKKEFFEKLMNGKIKRNTIGILCEVE